VTSLVGLARAIAQANGVADRIHHIREFSTHATLPERVDVVVCDQIGRFGFDAGVVEYFDDARRRLLGPGGRLVPSALEFWVAPVECAEAHARVEFWQTRPAAFDVSPARTIAVNSGYPRHFRPEELLGAPAAVGRVDLTAEAPRPIRLETVLPIARAGTLHGIGGWFSARLSPSVTMTNSPLAPDRINRRNVFLPVDRPVDLTPDDEVRVALLLRPEDSVLVWKVSVGPAGDPDRPRARFTQSTWRGMLFDRGDLDRVTPDHRPRLTPRGEARRSVLELADGERTVEAIEREVHRRHGHLFASADEAAVFVAEVLTRYSD
jgi:hypothetical protein